MEGGEPCRKLLNLIPRSREWALRGDKEEMKRHGSGVTEEKNLELRLGPPVHDEDQSLLSLTHFSSAVKTSEKKPFSPPSSAPKTAVHHNSQKRTAPGPVVGWPPVRSFRKNLAGTSSSKPVTETPNAVQTKDLVKKPVELNQNMGLFVKINMDGVPIGRKIDLNAYDSYEQLSSAVDDLFRGLLASSKDSFSAGKNHEEERPITGLLDGKGEYTLVYEDNEGDKMLVGDVPWHMFVSTVKRLRVRKSSELSSALTLGSSKPEKMTA